jgi:hypothetical protein
MYFHLLSLMENKIIITEFQNIQQWIFYNTLFIVSICSRGIFDEKHVWWHILKFNFLRRRKTHIYTNASYQNQFKLHILCGKNFFRKKQTHIERISSSLIIRNKLNLVSIRKELTSIYYLEKFPCCKSNISEKNISRHYIHYGEI